MNDTADIGGEKGLGPRGLSDDALELACRLTKKNVAVLEDAANGRKKGRDLRLALRAIQIKLKVGHARPKGARPVAVVPDARPRVYSVEVPVGYAVITGPDGVPAVVKLPEETPLPLVVEGETVETPAKPNKVTYSSDKT